MRLRSPRSTRTYTLFPYTTVFRSTLATIRRILREGLGYHVSYAVLNAANFGLPQSRERIVIVASRDRPFDFPVFPALPRRPVADILDDGSDVEYLDPDSSVFLDASLVRPEDRRVGRVWGSTCICRVSPQLLQKKIGKHLFTHIN